MILRRHLAIFCMATCPLCLSAREALNFYVPDTLPASSKKPSDEKPYGKKKDDPKKEQEPVDKDSKKSSESSSETDTKSSKDHPEKKAEARETPKAKAAESKPDDKAPVSKKSAAATIDLHIRSNRPREEFNPPLDPFGLATAFHTRWDFSSFLISAEEELRFRLNAARARTLRLAHAFSALSDEVQTRQRNLNSAALAAYLLSRDQQSWAPAVGRNLTEAQLLAVHATMKQDIGAMQSALTDYETLRNALNASAEEVANLDKNGLDAAAKRSTIPDDAITVPAAAVAYAQTGSVLSERLVSIEALKAALASEHLRQTTSRRQSIASFSPPPPGVTHIIPNATTLPQPVSAEVMKNQPRGETMNQPERDKTLMVQTSVNAPIYAVRDGIVAYAGPFRGYGDMVILEHQKGVFSIYSHLANIQVLERQPIVAGALLGRAGNLPEINHSGIHFQVRQGKTPLKPEEWLGTSQVDKLIAGK